MRSEHKMAAIMFVAWAVMTVALLTIDAMKGAAP